MPSTTAVPVVEAGARSGPVSSGMPSKPSCPCAGVDAVELVDAVVVAAGLDDEAELLPPPPPQPVTAAASRTARRKARSARGAACGSVGIGPGRYRADRPGALLPPCA